MVACAVRPDFDLRYHALSRVILLNLILKSNLTIRSMINSNQLELLNLNLYLLVTLNPAKSHRGLYDTKTE